MSRCCLGGTCTDASRFDSLSKTVGTQRRTVLGGLLAGLLLPLEAAARKTGKGKDKPRKGKGKGRHKGKDTQRANAQAEPCWRAGACIVSKGSNVSQCDLAGYTAPDPLDCTRCNLSRANLRGADLTGVNFTRANLSGACLVDANLSGAIVTNTSNLYNAIFCRTIMPDGSVNNSGCGSGTACCPTCIDGGETCGPGIGGTCCGSAQCSNGTCRSCATCASLGNVCGSFPDGCGQTLTCQCGATATPSCANGTCANGTCASCAAVCAATGCNCLNLVDGSTQCGRGGIFACINPCATNADCVQGALCVSSAGLLNGRINSLPQSCGLTTPGVCVRSSTPCAAP